MKLSHRQFLIELLVTISPQIVVSRRPSNSTIPNVSTKDIWIDGLNRHMKLSKKVSKDQRTLGWIYQIFTLCYLPGRYLLRFTYQSHWNGTDIPLAEWQQHKLHYSSIYRNHFWKGYFLLMNYFYLMFGQYIEALGSYF